MALMASITSPPVGLLAGLQYSSQAGLGASNIECSSLDSLLDWLDHHCHWMVTVWLRSPRKTARPVMAHSVGTEWHTVSLTVLHQ